MHQSSLAQEIARLEHGQHVCSFYRDFADQVNTLIPWVHEAVRRGECCVYITDDQTAEDVQKLLNVAGIDVDAETQRGALVFLTKWEWRHKGDFDRTTMARHVKVIVDTALAGGFKGLWAAVEMTWTKAPDIGADDVARWEGMWNDLLMGMPVVLLCTYDRSQFDPGFLRPELFTHPFIIHEGELYPNHFYDRNRIGEASPLMDSDEVLESMLAHIRERMGPSAYHAATETTAT